MTGVRASFVVLTLLLGVVGAQQLPAGCGVCDSSKCPATEQCPGAEAMDSCGCCVVCQRSLGQRCDSNKLRQVTYGPCGKYLTCMPREDIAHSAEWTCQCQQQTEVCGSDGTSYRTLCNLLEASKSNAALTMDRQGACLSKPVIKTPPQSSERQLGGILVLDCEASGVPVPEITWELYKKNGESIKLPNDDSNIAVQIRGGPESHMITGWVQIMKVTEETTGTYVCNAKNSQGEDKATARITYFEQANVIT